MYDKLFEHIQSSSSTEHAMLVHLDVPQLATHLFELGTPALFSCAFIETYLLQLQEHAFPECAKCLQVTSWPYIRKLCFRAVRLHVPDSSIRQNMIARLERGVQADERRWPALGGRAVPTWAVCAHCRSLARHPS